MYVDNKILIAKNEEKELFIMPDKANRHGLITGASGSGKTITLKVMAESFSAMGVPVFLADVKGDLAGTVLPGETNSNIEERLEKLNIKNFDYKGFPCVFWDVFGKDGHPIRTTMRNIGPTILSRMLGLNETQEGVLSIIFKISKDEELELIDLKDLRLLLQYVADNKDKYIVAYGNITNQTIGTIQRALLTLEEQGGDNFFGEPEIDIKDFLNFNSEGKGNINILHSIELYKKPTLYSSFMLWLLTFLSYEMEEVGDLEKPRLVFFFDEAHLLFNNMPKYMLEQVIQIVKLIRSKGIGLYFISQMPQDIPAEILAQLGNKVQHTLRAYTPAEQRNIKAVADSFRANPDFNTEEAIMSLGTGEAVISFLNEKGEPNVVEKALILPPQSQMGTIDDSTRLMVMSRSDFKGKYDELVDNESAYEKLKEIFEEKSKQKEEEIIAKAEEKRKKEEAKEEKERLKEEERQAKEEEKQRKAEEKERKNNPFYKLGKKAVNKTTNKALDRVITKIFRSFLGK